MEVGNVSSGDASNEPVNFSLAEGGPGIAVLRRLHMVRPEGGFGSFRTVVILIALSWIPLFALCSIEGLAWGRSRIPFFHDIGVQVRFLLALPVLVLAEIPIGRSFGQVTQRLVSSHLIRESDLAKFQQILADAARRRDSLRAGIVLIALVYVSSLATVYKAPYETGNTWFHPNLTDSLSLAGYWYALISLPIFQFLVMRWIYRLWIWGTTLSRISKLDLALTPAHPDRAGGLAFISQSLVSLGTLLFAISAVASATIANRIIYDGEKFAEYQWAYLIFIVVLVMVLAGPMCVFTPKLMALKERGLLQYSELASTHHQLFHAKWVAAEREVPLDGVESRAALATSFEAVEGLRPVPINLSDLAAMIIPALLPAIPLLLIVMPAAVLLQDVLKIVRLL